MVADYADRYSIVEVAREMSHSKAIASNFCLRNPTQHDTPDRKFVVPVYSADHLASLRVGKDVYCTFVVSLAGNHAISKAKQGGPALEKLRRRYRISDLVVCQADEPGVGHPRSRIRQGSFAYETLVSRCLSV